MLDTTPQSWRERIWRCKTVLDRIKPAHLDRIRSYAGPGYTGESDRSRYDPVGTYFGAISRRMPLMVSGNPRVVVGSSHEEGQQHAAMLEAALNRLIVQSRRRQLNEMLAVDYQLGPFAVSLTTREPIPGFSEFEDPRHWPAWHRICPFDFLWDTDEQVWTYWRFQGHRVVMDRDDALAIAENDTNSGWDADSLRDIAAGVVESRRNRGPLDTEDREQFEYYEIWCPEVTREAINDLGYDPGDEDEHGRPYTPEGGYNGYVFYVMPDAEAGATDGFIRDPQPFYGPRDGPYQFYPGYFIPYAIDGMTGLPLAPQLATVAQAEAEATGVKAMLRAIDRRKKLVAISSTTPDLADSIEEEEDGGIIVLNDVAELDRHVKEFSTGGPDAELLGSAAYLRDIHQTANGSGEGQSGQYGRRGDTSATEVAVATKATSTMIEFQALKFREGNEGDVTKAAWYLFHDEQVEIQLGAEHKFALITGGPGSAALRRHPNSTAAERAKLKYGSLEAGIRILEKQEKADRETHEQDPFNGFDFSIVQRSVERTADGMAQMQLLTLKDSLPWLFEMLMRPGVRERETLRMYGELSGQSGLERIVNIEELRAFKALMLQMQLQPEQPAPKPQLRRAQPPAALSFGQKPAASQAPSFQMPSSIGGTGATMAGRSTGSKVGAAAKKSGAA